MSVQYILKYYVGVGKQHLKIIASTGNYHPARRLCRASGINRTEVEPRGGG